MDGMRTRREDSRDSGEALARNTVLNVVGQALPLLATVVAIPPALRALGADRFALLSLAWVVLGYFGALDLGLGRATTKFVAEYEDRAPKEDLGFLVWTSLIGHLLLGSVVGCLIALAARPTALHLLNIPTHLSAEAAGVFAALAAAPPAVLAVTCMTGVLEGMRRFALSNAISVTAKTLGLCTAALMAVAGGSVSQIVLVIVGVWLGAAIASLTACLVLLPVLRSGLAFRKGLLVRLVGYGKWLAVFSSSSFLIVYLDRFVIATLMPLSAVVLYTVPFDITVRLGLLPSAIARAVFPTFSSLPAEGRSSALNYYFSRSTKHLLVTVGWTVVILATFPSEILGAWLGKPISEGGANIMRLLSVSMLINSFAYMPSAYLQASGRPDVPAKIHLAQLPVHAALVFALVSMLGPLGAALAWTIFVAINLGLLWFFASRPFGIRGAIDRSVVRALLILGLVAGAAALIKVMPVSAAERMLTLGIVSAVYALGCWLWVLDASERNRLLQAVRRSA